MPGNDTTNKQISTTYKQSKCTGLTERAAVIAEKESQIRRHFTARKRCGRAYRVIDSGKIRHCTRKGDEHHNTCRDRRIRKILSYAAEKLFHDYYVSFAESYTRALVRSGEELDIPDPTTVAYMLMGISNFVGLRAIFENMNDADIDKILDEAIMPALSRGIFKNCEN